CPCQPRRRLRSIAVLRKVKKTYTTAVVRLALRAAGANGFFAPQFVACFSERARNRAPGLPQRGSLYPQKGGSIRTALYGAGRDPSKQVPSSPQPSEPLAARHTDHA